MSYFRGLGGVMLFHDWRRWLWNSCGLYEEQTVRRRINISCFQIPYEFRCVYAYGRPHKIWFKPKDRLLRASAPSLQGIFKQFNNCTIPGADRGIEVCGGGHMRQGVWWSPHWEALAYQSLYGPLNKFPKTLFSRYICHLCEIKR